MATKCRHCGANIVAKWRNISKTSRVTLAEAGKCYFEIHKMDCSKCGLSLIRWKVRRFKWSVNKPEVANFYEYVYPRTASYNKQQHIQNIPEILRQDYEEAYALMDTSPRASAAMAKMCLDKLLTQFGYKAGTLPEKVNAALRKKKKNALEKKVKETFEHLHKLATFGGRRRKKTPPGEIVEVAKGEARYCLNAVNALAGQMYKKVDVEDKQVKGKFTEQVVYEGQDDGVGR